MRAKLIICLYSIILVLTGCFIKVDATGNSFIKEAEIVLYKTALYDSEISKEKYHIDDKIIHYKINNNEYVLNNDYEIYPIYRENVLIGLIYKNSDGSYALGEYFAKSLNELVNVSEKFTIINKDNSVYVCQNEKISLVFSVDNKSPQKLFNKDIFVRRYSLEYLDSYIKYDLAMLDYGSVINTIYHKSMTSSNDCWAACIASIVQFKGTTTSTYSVIVKTGNTGSASLANVSSYLTNDYDITHDTYGYQLGFNSAMSYVGNNHPIIANCERIGGGNGHMVVIKGVYYLSSGTNDALYILMDPYSNSDVNVVTKSDSVLSFVSFGGNTYKWYQSIVID